MTELDRVQYSRASAMLLSACSHDAKGTTSMTSTSPSFSSPICDQPSRSSRVAVVTGASSGIDLHLVKKLITKGYRVVANSRNITTAGTLRTTDDLKLVDGDIGTQRTAERVVGTAIQEFGRIDLLVNNAGVFIPKPFTEYTADDFLRINQTNLYSRVYPVEPCQIGSWTNC